MQTLGRKCKNGLTKRSGFCLTLSKCINFQLLFLFSLVRFVKQNYFPHFWFGQKLKTAVRLVPFVPIELNLGSFIHTMALSSWLSLWKTVLPICHYKSHNWFVLAWRMQTHFSSVDYQKLEQGQLLLCSVKNNDQSSKWLLNLANK